ncbi:cupin domain-containing protein [Pleionea sediminis]|uniref:cupin domain-containing protein n=1 Tax=Pleionea sediminis TaxID=2569479 RepID=UPI001185E24B|nr:cupin domain-containing protein [Pleionea sediminis]
MTLATIIKFEQSREYYFKEGCYINELSNSEADPDVSVAQARVSPGVTTQWHRLNNTVERYIILCGEGLVEVDGLSSSKVKAGDVVIIPEQHWQRITNTGTDDLLFHAICSPRFEEQNYQSRED